MSEVFDVANPEELITGLRQARGAISRKQAVVIPTDTTYALAVDAFSPAAVTLLREIKGWSTPVPPQVLIPGLSTLPALAASVEEPVQKLADAFWPGPLTLIVPAGESLQWDLGHNRGTVALRIPADLAARELLADTGPLAVTQASPVGKDIGRDPAIIREEFAELVAVYLSRGVLPEQPVSTVVDATGLGFPEGKLRVVREGAVTLDQIREVVGPEVLPDESSDDASPAV
jgi:tRNA threonylcarbamoyl adenosine modification protein (Sua5/YciO/YrdC/YwlC family)